MATVIRVSGVDVERVPRSIVINDALGRRSTASFVLVDRTGIANYTKGQEIDIFTEIAFPPFIHPQFNGYIASAVRKRVSPRDDVLYWSIRCMDNHYLADKRIVAESYTGQTAGFIVNDLFDKYLQPEGVTIGAIQAGVTIAEAIINYVKVSDAINALANKCNFVWLIDKGKQLWFMERGTTTAPFAITTDDIIKETEIMSSLAEDSPFYRNRQYIRAGLGTTVPQVETRTGDGETVAFPMGYPLNNEPIITLDAAPQTIGIKGIDTAVDWYWTKGDAIITAAVAPAIAEVVECTYVGQYNIMVQADDLDEQSARQAIEGGTGIVEVIDDAPSINDSDDAFDLALAKLDYYGVIGKQFEFPIRQWGLEPGQMVTVTHVPYGLATDELLVTSVDISEFAPGEMRYTVQAIEGPETGDWTGFFKSLADTKSDIMERFTVGRDQVLIILVREAEGVEVAESVSETVFACPIPSVTLFPLVTLYPC